MLAILTDLALGLLLMFLKTTMAMGLQGVALAHIHLGQKLGYGLTWTMSVNLKFVHNNHINGDSVISCNHNLVKVCSCHELSI